MGKRYVWDNHVEREREREKDKKEKWARRKKIGR